jgi:hypothetical protein
MPNVSDALHAAEDLEKGVIRRFKSWKKPSYIHFRDKVFTYRSGFYNLHDSQVSLYGGCTYKITPLTGGFSISCGICSKKDLFKKRLGREAADANSEVYYICYTDLISRRLMKFSLETLLRLDEVALHKHLTRDLYNICESLHTLVGYEERFVYKIIK